MSATIDCFDIAYGPWKFIFFDHVTDICDEPVRLGLIRPDPARPDTALTVFDGLILSEVKNYIYEILTQCGSWFHNCHNKLKKKL